MVSQIQTDVELLTMLIESKSVEIQEDAPVYPFLFAPDAKWTTTKSTFVSIGTNDPTVALKMVLWKAAAVDVNTASKHSPGSTEYKQLLARAFQLGLVAEKTAPDHSVIQYNPPMVTMKLGALIGLLLEIGVYNIEVSRCPEPSGVQRNRFLGIQRNVGVLIREMWTGAGLPSSISKKVRRLQEWHRREIAVLLIGELSEMVTKMGSDTPSSTVAETYLEIEALGVGCAGLYVHPLVTEAAKQLHKVGWARNATEGYMPKKWNSIVTGDVYTTLPLYESWCAKCRRIKYYGLAETLLPSLPKHGASRKVEATAGGGEEAGEAGAGAAAAAAAPVDATVREACDDGEETGGDIFDAL